MAGHGRRAYDRLRRAVKHPPSIVVRTRTTVGHAGSGPALLQRRARRRFRREAAEADLAVADARRPPAHREVGDQLDARPRPRGRCARRRTACGPTWTGRRPARSGRLNARPEHRPKAAGGRGPAQRSPPRARRAARVRRSGAPPPPGRRARQASTPRRRVVLDQERRRRRDLRRAGEAPADDAVRRSRRRSPSIGPASPPTRAPSEAAPRGRRRRPPRSRARRRARAPRAAAGPNQLASASSRSKTPTSSRKLSPSQMSRLNVPSASCRPPPPAARPRFASSAAAAASGSSTAMTTWSMPRITSAQPGPGRRPGDAAARTTASGVLSAATPPARRAARPARRASASTSPPLRPSSAAISGSTPQAKCSRRSSASSRTARTPGPCGRTWPAPSRSGGRSRCAARHAAVARRGSRPRRSPAGAARAGGGRPRSPTPGPSVTVARVGGKLADARRRAPVARDGGRRDMDRDPVRGEEPQQPAQLRVELPSPDEIDDRRLCVRHAGERSGARPILTIRDQLPVYDPAMPTAATDITVHPLTTDRWDDLAGLFQEGGDPKWCWCQFYRERGLDWSNSTADDNRERLASLTRDGPPPGLVAYREGRAVGWVSLAPRPAFDRLNHAKVLAPVDDQPVWSIVCFVVSRTARGNGVATALLDGAIDWARGARERRSSRPIRPTPAAGRSPPRTPITARSRCSSRPDSRSSHAASSTERPVRRSSGASYPRVRAGVESTNRRRPRVLAWRDATPTVRPRRVRKSWHAGHVDERAALRHLSYRRHRHSSGLTVASRRA